MSSKFHKLRVTATAVGVALCAYAAHTEKGAREAVLSPNSAKSAVTVSSRDQAILQRALHLYSLGDYAAAGALLDAQFVRSANAQRPPEELLQALTELRLRAQSSTTALPTGFEQQVML